MTEQILKIVLTGSLIIGGLLCYWILVIGLAKFISIGDVQPNDKDRKEAANEKQN